jgi:hypothetical protein
MTLNATLPLWHENQTIIPSASGPGHWSVVIRAFSEDEVIRPPAFDYAVAHATRVVIAAPDAGAWFRAKGWLRQHGAAGVIHWQHATNGLSGHETRITLSR